jgi:hypothetical protein
MVKIVYPRNRIGFVRTTGLRARAGDLAKQSQFRCKTIYSKTLRSEQPDGNVAGVSPDARYIIMACSKRSHIPASSARSGGP